MNACLSLVTNWGVEELDILWDLKYAAGASVLFVFVTKLTNLCVCGWAGGSAVCQVLRDNAQTLSEFEKALVRKSGECDVSDRLLSYPQHLVELSFSLPPSLYPVYVSLSRSLRLSFSLFLSLFCVWMSLQLYEI